MLLLLLFAIDSDLLLSIDKHHSGHNGTLDCNQFVTLHVHNFVYNFKSCDYTNIVRFIGDLFLSVYLNKYMIIGVRIGVPEYAVPCH